MLAADAAAQGLLPGAARTVPEFVDQAAPAFMAEHHVPGVAIAIVHDGQTVYLRGFGVSNLTSTRPVDASTAFRVGSVSKLVTAIAVLQLVEAGKLDLNEDIRRFLPGLDLLAATTTHHLLTHTAGFDERRGGAYTEATPLPSLSEHLQHKPAAQVIKPGRAYSYSNYNYAVAGAVIEAVGGQSFEQYISAHIAAPLGLTSTSAYQPPPGNAMNVATGYHWDGNRHVALPTRFTFASPSGGLTTSAADMAKLMLALLGQHTPDRPRLLSEASTRQLLDAQYTPHPAIPAATYGALQWQSRSVTFVFKDGTLGDQVGAVLLDPRGCLGLFVGANALQIEPLVSRILTHLYGPVTQTERPAPMPNAADRASQYAGVFRNFHHTRNDLSRLFALMPTIQTRVVPGADGSIQWNGRTWIEVEPRLFQRVDGADRILFRGNDVDAVTELHAWGASYERIGFFEQAPFHLGVLVACLISFISYPIAAFRRGRVSAARTAWSTRARFGGALLALVNVGFTAGLVLLFRDLGSSVPLPLTWQAWLSLPIAGLLLSAAAVSFAVAAWSTGWWHRGERLAHSMLAAGSVVFLVWLNYWKLLGFHY
jgi:CubicO group peptidase (beta-lactamase class C family)